MPCWDLFVTVSHGRGSNQRFLSLVRPRKIPLHPASPVPLSGSTERCSQWVTYMDFFCFCLAATGCPRGGRSSRREGPGFIWLPGPQQPRSHHEERWCLNSAQFHQQGAYSFRLLPSNKGFLHSPARYPYFSQSTFFWCCFPWLKK